MSIVDEQPVLGGGRSAFWPRRAQHSRSGRRQRSVACLIPLTVSIAVVSSDFAFWKAGEGDPGEIFDGLAEGVTAALFDLGGGSGWVPSVGSSGRRGRGVGAVCGVVAASVGDVGLPHAPAAR